MASPEFIAHKREKAFPLHYDAWQYYPDHSVALEELASLQEDGPEAVWAQMGDKPLKAPKYKHLYRKIKAGFNDPICHYALLDILVQMQRGLYLRPGYIKDVLNNRWPQYVWSNQLIGRMLGGLSRLCARVYMECEKNSVPFTRGRDGKGNYWVVDPKGGNEGLLWLVKARDIFLGLGEAVMDREAVMRVEVLEASTYEYQRPEEFYADYLWFRIRDADDYLASQRPGTPFGRNSQTRQPAVSPYGG